MGLFARGISTIALRSTWLGLIATSLAQVYLILLLALTAIATVPLLLGWSGSVVESGSMQPKVSPGDIVLSSALPADSPVPVGGVVEFTRPAVDGTHTVTVLHRVVKGNPDGTFVTAGDANSDVDSTPISRDQITGQARLLVPYIGLPILWVGASNLAAVAGWMVATLVATVLASTAVSAARHAKEETDDHAVDEGSSSSDSQASRRAVLGVVLGTVVVGSSLLPRERLTAAFTSRTSSINNSWTVRLPPALNPGRLTPYVVFAGRSVVNDGYFDFSTYLDGSVGTSPGGTIQGFYSWQISGGVDRDNQVARNARTDALALYASLEKQAKTQVLKSRLTGRVSPGTYESKTRDFSVEDTLTLDAKGDQSAVFVFRASDITLRESAYVSLVNGAKAANVYWLAAKSIVLSQNSVSSGTFIARSSASSERYADYTGRLVSLDGDVLIDRTTARRPA